MIGFPLHRRRIAACLIVALPVILAGSSRLSFGRDAMPLQVTFESAPGVQQASAAMGPGYDTTLGAVEILHTVWMANDRIYYRAGRLGNLSRLHTLVPGPQHSSDPALIVSATGVLTLMWAEERSPDPDARGRIIIVPGEWNLRLTRDPRSDAIWFNEDAGIPMLIPDRHPTMAKRNDSVLVVWERGVPPQVHYAFLTPTASPLDAPKLPIVGSPRPGTRPQAAVGRSGEFWVVWTVEDVLGSDLWATSIGRSGAAPAMPVRLGPTDDRSPAIAVDSFGRPHIVWQQGLNGGPIRYVYGLVGGGFTPIITVTPPGTTARNPQIVIPGDDVPRVLWQSAEGGIDMTLVFGTRPLPPVTLIPGTLNPRQRVEGIAEIWPGIFVSPSGAIVTTFIAPDPNTQGRNVWVNLGTEERAGAPVLNLSAELVRSEQGGVLLRWDVSSTDGIARFDVRRRRAGQDEGDGRSVASVSASSQGDGTFAFLDPVAEPGHYLYRVDALDPYGATVGSASAAISLEPSSEVRIRATPNPFNGATILLITVVFPADVEANVFSVAGHRVRTLLNTRLEPGERRVAWDGSDDEGRPLGTGRYYVRCRVTPAQGDVVLQTIALTLLR